MTSQGEPTATPEMAPATTAPVAAPVEPQTPSPGVAPAAATPTEAVMPPSAAPAATGTAAPSRPPATPTPPSSAEPAATEPSGVGGGTIAGRITHAGASTRGTLKADKDIEVCGVKPIPDETLLVGKGGGLANVVVSVEGLDGHGPGPRKVPLDQKDCVYAPHVQAARVGSDLMLNNSDPVLHNVHGYAGDSTVFNLAMPLKDMKIPKKLDRPGVVRLKCDAGHTWMSAYVIVKPHGFFAVTGRDGTFRIEGVPLGEHKIELWHEKLGTKTVPVAVSASGPTRADVTW